jgi:hypothetical protein
MDADYHLVSHWQVPGTLEDVAAILREPRDLVRWWPEVYLDIQVENEDAGGTVVRVHSRGRHPVLQRLRGDDGLPSGPQARDRHLGYGGRDGRS